MTKLSEPGTELERLCWAERMLATIDRADEALHLANMAEAARVWAIREHQATPVVNHATSIKARALRRMAECVDEGQARGEIEKPGGDRKSQIIVLSPDNDPPVTLADLDIPRQRLHEARKLPPLGEAAIRAEGAKATTEDRRASVAPLIQAAKREEVIAALEDTAAQEAKAIQGVYDVIVIDPPWPYASRANDPTHLARNPYPTMSLEDLAELSIPAGPDCALWLWTTNAFIREAYHLLEHWGFKPITILTWAKDRKGTGDWLQGQTEHCILALKGKPPATHTNQSTLLVAPRREHSRKPDEFYTLVASLCPGRRLEMFARERRDGWEAHGAEVAKF
jgi:N6-adenosine-specific RNA methylase IME4